MPPSPFAHGLALAWSDGALSREGALMLERLQGLLGLSDKERAQQEERWLSEISKNDRRSFGDGDQILREWLEGLKDMNSLAPVARSMGRSALDIGLSKSSWKEAIAFANGLGLGNDLSMGVWLEEDSEPLNGWPSALDPLAVILGLVISVPESKPTTPVNLSEGPAYVVIRNEEANPSNLSWMPDLIPVNNENCAWGWSHGEEPTTQPPSGDLVFCNSILLAWIRRLIAMRHKRGESGLEGLSKGVQVMPSSSEIESEDNRLKLSMIVDLGEGRLVRPWASVSVDGSVKLDAAPEGIGENWKTIHNAIGQVLITALETLPRQLTQAAGLNQELGEVKLNEGWIVQSLD